MSCAALERMPAMELRNSRAYQRLRVQFAHRMCLTLFSSKALEMSSSMSYHSLNMIALSPTGSSNTPRTKDTTYLRVRVCEIGTRQTMEKAATLDINAMEHRLHLGAVAPLDLGQSFIRTTLFLLKDECQLGLFETSAATGTPTKPSIQRSLE